MAEPIRATFKQLLWGAHEIVYRAPPFLLDYEFATVFWPIIVKEMAEKTDPDSEDLINELSYAEEAWDAVLIIEAFLGIQSMPLENQDNKDHLEPAGPMSAGGFGIDI